MNEDGSKTIRTVGPKADCMSAEMAYVGHRLRDLYEANDRAATTHAVQPRTPARVARAAAELAGQADPIPATARAPPQPPPGTPARTGPTVDPAAVVVPLPGTPDLKGLGDTASAIAVNAAKDARNAAAVNGERAINALVDTFLAS